MRTNNKIQLYPMLRLVIALTAGIIAADIIGTCLRPLYWLMAMAVTLADAVYSCHGDASWCIHDM